jgi:hypothetical protein
LLPCRAGCDSRRASANEPIKSGPKGPLRLLTNPVDFRRGFVFEAVA